MYSSSSKWCCFRAAAVLQHASHQRCWAVTAAWACSAASLKRPFDIWLLEGLFPCCCFFPLGGMKQAHHKNCERARASRHAGPLSALKTIAAWQWRQPDSEQRQEQWQICAAGARARSLTDSSFANWSGLRESHAAALAKSSEGHHICSSSPQILLYRHTLTQRWQSSNAKILASNC